MRLGGLGQQFPSPDEWVQALQDAGYRPAYCLVSIDALKPKRTFLHWKPCPGHWTLNFNLNCRGQA